MTDGKLHIRLLGMVAIEDSEGNPIAIVGGQARNMFAYLALYAGRTHTRDELITLFWPEEDPDLSRPRLRQTLYSLRQQIAQALGVTSEFLVTTRTNVGFSPAKIETDVAAFEAAGARALSSRNAKENLSWLEQAINCYHDEVAPGIYLEPILAVRNRLSSLFLKLLQLQTLAYEQMDQLEKAIESAHRILSIDVLAENTYCDLMRLYNATGQPSAVLKQYQELQRILKTELNEQPHESTQALFESLRRSGKDSFVAPSQSGVFLSQDEVPPPPPQIAPASSHSAPIDVKPLAPPLRRGLILSILCLVILFVSGFMLLQSRKNSYLVRPIIPEKMWEYRFPVENGDSNSEPTAIMLASGEKYFAVTGFVQTERYDNNFITSLFNVEGKCLWQKRYDGPSHDVDRARSVSIDSLNDIFVTGESDNGKGNDTTRLSGLDIATIKYDFKGNQLWVARYNGLKNGEDRPCRVIAIGEGHCIVAGYSNEGINLEGSPRFAAVLIGYNASGKQLWTQRFCGSEDLDCRFCDLTIASGSVVAAGRTYHRTSKGIETEYFLSRFAGDGKLLWRRQISASLGEDQHDAKLTTDNASNILVLAPSHNSSASDHGIGVDYLLAKYDIDGNIKWVQNYDATAHLDDRARALAVTSGNEVVVTGESLTAPNDLDTATLRFNSEGALQWLQRFAGHAHSADCPNDIVATKDAVYVTGFTSTTRSDYIGNRDLVTLKYDLSGALIWKALYDGPQHSADRGICLALDNVGNVIVVGQSDAPPSGIVILKYAR